MTDKPPADVWRERDLRVLAAVTRRIDAGKRPVRVRTVAEAACRNT